MEAMALESLVASVWRLDGFLAVTRHPVQVHRGYSDIDVLGVRADGAVRLGECKARGRPRRIYVDRGNGWSAWWDESFANCARVWVDPPAFLPAISDVTALEYHLVGNVWFSDEAALQAAEKRLTAELRKTLPRRLRSRAKAFVRPSADLVLDAMRAVRAEIVDDGWKALRRSTPGRHP